MKTAKYWLLLSAVLSALLVTGCSSKSSPQSTDKASTSVKSKKTTSPARKSSTSSKKAEVSKQPAVNQKYATGFKATIIPASMRGKWYGYPANTDSLSTMNFGKNTVSYPKPEGDGKTYATYDGNVRTKDDRDLLSSLNGGSATTPKYTTAQKYRMAHWVAATNITLSGHKSLNLWQQWYPSDAGNIYYLQQKRVGPNKYNVLVDATSNDIYYSNKKLFTGKDGEAVANPIPTVDDFFVLGYLYHAGYSLHYAYDQIVNGSHNLCLSADGAKIWLPNAGNKLTDVDRFPASLKNQLDQTILFVLDRSKNIVKNARDSFPVTVTLAKLQEKMFVNGDDLAMLQAIRIRMQQNGLEAK